MVDDKNYAYTSGDSKANLLLKTYVFLLYFTMFSGK